MYLVIDYMVLSIKTPQTREAEKYFLNAIWLCISFILCIMFPAQNNDYVELKTSA